MLFELYRTNTCFLLYIFYLIFLLNRAEDFFFLQEYMILLSGAIILVSTKRENLYALIHYAQLAPEYRHFFFSKMR